MKSALILMTLASWSTGQLIYPDEYESILAATARPQAFQSTPLPFSNSITDDYNRFEQVGSPPSQSQRRHTPRNPKSDSQIDAVISKGVLNFTLNMEARIRSRLNSGSHENVVFSPLSVAATLALVLLGSAKKTFDEVSMVLGWSNDLHISENSEAVHRRFGALISATRGQAGQSTPEASFANGLFVRDGYPIRPQFMAASQSIYDSEVLNLNYEYDANIALKTVNSWVNEKTRGKIPSILNGPPPAETNIIIVSALYFNGEWNQHFIDGATRRKNFTVAPDEVVGVDMMYNGGEFLFFDDRQLGAKIVALPYKGQEVTMYVVLPNDKSYGALNSLQRRLTVDSVGNLIRNMRAETCIIGLPRMNLSSTSNLRDTLQSLGLKSLFNPNAADLSLISDIYTGAQLTGGNRGGIGTPTLQRPIDNDTKFGIIFSRVKDGDNQNSSSNNNRQNFTSYNDRQNYFSYNDTLRGYHVEQWETGFRIRRISRRRRSLSPREWRVQRNAVLKHEEETFEKKEGETSSDNLQRSRRQTAQQINQGIQNDGNNRNQSPFQIDYIRNNVALRNPLLSADDVLHRVVIDISEKGTEAAAATSVILTKDGNQKRLVADRPFLFFIRHEPTGLILFWGSVHKPTPNYESLPPRF